MCYQRLGRVSQASAKLLPLYFVFIPVCVRVCAHKKMAFRLIQILLNEYALPGGGQVMTRMLKSVAKKMKLKEFSSKIVIYWP